MYKNKKGKPCTFSDSFILVIGYIQTSFYMPYRQTMDTIRATRKLQIPANSSCGHICKGINKLNIDIKRGKINDDDEFIIAIDSTGSKVTHRGL